MHVFPARVITFVGAALMAVMTPIPAASARDVMPGLASPWIEGFNYRLRMSGGAVPDEIGATYAFIEIAMTKGWKTYWRNPGDAGGIPPHFDWTKSQNLGEAKVLFPVPQRLEDSAGVALGYKEHVIFPVRVTAADRSKPVVLSLQMSFGVCEKLCVPADAALDLELPAAGVSLASADALAALALVPSDGANAGPDDPKLIKVRQELSGERPRLVFETQMPGDAAVAEIFIEVPDGLYIPMPKRIEGGSGAVVHFEVDVSKDVDLAVLKGKPVKVTLAGSKGQSEHIFTID